MNWQILFFACCLNLFTPLCFANFATDVRPFSIVRGKIDGMEIVKDLPAQHALAKLGVKKGDIILSLNYQDITNDEAAIKAYNFLNPSVVRILRAHRAIILMEKT